MVTMAEEDVTPLKPWVSEEKELLHMPLERYEYVGNNFEGYEATETLLEKYSYMVYGHPRNASYSIAWFKEEGVLNQAIEQWIHFAIDEQTASMLEAEGIPAIHPSGSGKPIDLLELLMRLNRIDKILYPTGIEVIEEMPALFDEMGVEYRYMPLFKKEGPGSGDLEAMRASLKQYPPHVLLVHSQRAAVRTGAAFPDLNYDDLILAAANKGTANKLFAQDLEPHIVGDGSYQTLFEKLDSLLSKQ